MRRNKDYYCEYCMRRHSKIHAFFKTFTCHEKFIVLDGLSNYEGVKTITNDVDFSIWWLKKNHPELLKRHIIYRDSEGIYDEILLDDEGKHKEFRSLSKNGKPETDCNKAMLRCLELHNEK